MSRQLYISVIPTILDVSLLFINRDIHSKSPLHSHFSCSYICYIKSHTILTNTPIPRLEYSPFKSLFPSSFSITPLLPHPYWLLVLNLHLALVLLSRSLKTLPGHPLSARSCLSRFSPGLCYPKYVSWCSYNSFIGHSFCHSFICCLICFPTLLPVLFPSCCYTCLLCLILSHMLHLIIPPQCPLNLQGCLLPVDMPNLSYPLSLSPCSSLPTHTLSVDFTSSKLSL